MAPPASPAIYLYQLARARPISLEGLHSNNCSSEPIARVAHVVDPAVVSDRRRRDASVKPKKERAHGREHGNADSVEVDDHDGC